METALEATKTIEQFGIIGFLILAVIVSGYVVKTLKKNADDCEKARLEDAAQRALEAKDTGERLSALNLALGELRGEVNVMRSLGVQSLPNGARQNDSIK